MKLYAISDLHLGFAENQKLLGTLQSHLQDWLIVAGDVTEQEMHFASSLRALTSRFQRVIWVPGNHDLWTVPTHADGLRGEAKYQHLVRICRDLGVLTPEDEYVAWPGEGPAVVLAPLFLLYDYSFRADYLNQAQALALARESGSTCADEELLFPDPHPSRQDWCAARCGWTEGRLSAIPAGTGTVLVNHFPLRREHALLPAIPHFTPWCGTRRSEDWHLRFRAQVVVYGHLHIRGTRWLDGVRFEEVSLGYPRQWQRWGERSLEEHLCEILPGPVLGSR